MIRKNKKIIRFLEKLFKTIPEELIEFTNNYNGDLCAIEIRSKKEKNKWIYISSYKRKKGCYYSVFEMGDYNSKEYSVIKTHENIEENLLINEIFNYFSEK